jgi:competence protein ComEC
MFTIVVASKILPLQTDSLNSLYCTAFFLLLANPLLLFDISFQLSFLAVLGILTCMPFVNRLIEKYRRKGLEAQILKNIGVSLSAQSFATPIILYNFKTFPILFLLTNVIVVPFLGFILISIIFLICFMDIPFLNDVLSFVVNVELDVLVAIAKFVERLTMAIPFI